MAMVVQGGSLCFSSVVLLLFLTQYANATSLNCDRFPELSSPASGLRRRELWANRFSSPGFLREPSSDDALVRSDFPPDFIFGSATAAYQVEGAAHEDGRGPSVWDIFSEGSPERISDGSNGSVAIDFYHRYKDDVALMKEIGMDAFRFSISWSRVLPGGSLKNGGVNPQGIKFYNDLINEVISQGMTPYVTLFHWDAPQGLEDEYNGFLSRRIVKDFKDFAKVCFDNFGDRVKHWITLNEPWTFSVYGYDYGYHAPGRCSTWVNENCTAGNSSTEPYIVAHNLLLSHAAAVQLYRKKYQAVQKGQIGLTLNLFWMVNYTDSQCDIEAAERATDFMYGWFLHPTTYGDYPCSMKDIVQDRLPKFTAKQSKLLKKSYDFVGVNYYTARYAANNPYSNRVNVSYMNDFLVDLETEKDGEPIGTASDLSWLYVYPSGIKDLLKYTKEKYDNPTIYVTENGYSESNNKSKPLKESLNDTTRIDYYKSHLEYVQAAINEDEVDVKGFFTWSFADNYEWSDGYTARFGIVFIDYDDDLKRYPKSTTCWLQKFLQN
ncbi:beta-glucosidase 24-like [Malania oleifera]|uniref:beta-glucosidase 24-like n=1 Tax=Malania oleifera TaxID=397392 RepID=UPI0025AE7D50|nr:beta-glucosidase 24-like [Malania oleifera]